MKRPHTAPSGLSGSGDGASGARRPANQPRVAKPAKPQKAPRTGKPAKTAKQAQAAARRAGVWLGGIRFSGFTVLVSVLVVGGVIILAPELSTLVEQRQQIADLQWQTEQQLSQIADIDKQRARWDDPAYIRAQARERLYYVMPGEISYLVVNDVEIPDIVYEQVSTAAQQKSKDWLSGLFGSFMIAGLSADPLATPTPTPSPSQ